MREHGGTQIGDHALAEQRDEVVAQRARRREHRRDEDHHGEILVDQSDALAEKPKSIMRRTATGTIRVAAAAVSSAASAPITRPR